MNAPQALAQRRCDFDPTGYIDRELVQRVYPLSQLPDSVEGTVERFLDTRLARFWRDRLEFTGGTILKPQAEWRAGLSARPDDAAYTLNWEVKGLDLGDVFYTVEMHLDRMGRVVAFNLPHTWAEPDERFLPRSQAEALAAAYAEQRNWRTKIHSTALVYNQCADRLEWRIALLQATDDPAGLSGTRHLIEVSISGHRARVLRTEAVEEWWIT